MKNNYIVTIASICALSFGMTALAQSTQEGGSGSVTPPPIDHPMQVRPIAPGEMPMSGSMKPEPMLMDSGSSDGNEGGLEMKNPPKNGGTMTKEEMQNARPMEKDIDAPKDRMPMNGTHDGMLMKDGMRMDDETYHDVDLDIDVEKLMAQEAKEDHTGEVEIDEANDVRSGDDFEHFVAHKAQTDKHIRGVEVKNGKVKMSYAMPVKFLGFLNTTLDTTMTADASGAVDFDYPWYAVFMKKDFSKKTIEPALKAEIDAEKSVITAVDANSTTTTPTMKRTFAAPHVFEAMLGVVAKVKASWNLKENVK